MKAVVYHEYGSPQVLRLEDVPQPEPGDDDVLVRVSAVAINPGDWDILHGRPYVLRATTGLRRPRSGIPGLAIAGRVAETDFNPTAFTPGDEVYAEIAGGGFAEYAAVAATALGHKPANTTFEQAAAVPVVGVTALQAMRDVGKVQPDHHVLITGASGGVGSFAVQIAAVMGAEVTGVCSTANIDLVRSLGAHHVIDYTTTDFTMTGQSYDLILDNVGAWPLADLRRALSEKGMLIPNSNKGDRRWLGNYVTTAIKALTLSPFVSQKMRPFAAKGSSTDLAALTDLIEAGQVTPVVERTYPFDEAVDAFNHYGTGHATGKVVVSVELEEKEGS